MVNDNKQSKSNQIKSKQLQFDTITLEASFIEAHYKIQI